MARPVNELVIDLASGRQLRLRDGSPFDAPGSEPIDRLIALVPADRCSLIEVDLPEVPARKMMEALRWAIEDQIAGDPEQQHVVPVERIDSGRVRCLVVGLEDMRRWSASLPSAATAVMLPDAACLPAVDDALVMLSAGEQVLVRWGDQRFDRLDRSLLEDVLPEVQQESERVLLVLAYGDGWPDRVAGIPVEPRPLETDALAWLAHQAGRPEVVACNLLRGAFAIGRGAADRPSWKALGAAAALVGGLLLGQVLLERAWLVDTRDRTAAEVRGTLQRLFPEEGPWVRPQAQAERRLSALRGATGSDLMRLLGLVGPALRDAEGLQLDAIEYTSDGGLELSLGAPTLADIEAVQRQIDARAGQSRLRDVSVRDGRTQARLQVESRPLP